MLRFSIIFTFFFLLSCDATTRISKIDNKSQKVNSLDAKEPSSLDSFLTPYRQAMQNKMNDTLAYANYSLTKKKIESTLGNWVADGMLWYAQDRLNQPVDMAICNAGGLRVKSLPTGAIQLKHIYELMPFENELVIVEVDSVDFKILLERIAQKDGWPVSRGFQLHLSEDNTILDWKINGTRKAQYRLVISDYMATGGDGLNNLIGKQRTGLNVLIRDALIQYAKSQKNLDSKIENRIQKDKSDANE